MYRLIVFTKGGDNRVHYYSDYDSMDYDAVMLEFSTNVAKAYAQKRSFTKWETLFTIG